MNLIFKWIEDLNSFKSIKKKWNDLNKLTRGSIFLSHEWFDSALHWLDEKEIKILCLYDNQDLIGILPLTLSKEKKGYTIYYLQSMHIPDTQEFDIIAHPKIDKKKLVELFFSEIKKSHFKWHYYQLKHLQKNSILTQVLSKQEKNYHSILEKSLHPLVRMQPSWKKYYYTLSSKLRKSNRGIANKIIANNHLDLIKITNTKDKKHLNILEDIALNSWKTKTKNSLNTEGPRQFIENLLHNMPENKIVIWLLKFNHDYIAYELQLNHYNQIYALRSDFKETYRHLSPGTYLNWKVIESLHKEKFKKYYMGPGLNSYKLKWCNEKVKILEIIGFNLNPMGLTLSTFYKIKLTIKYYKKKWF